MPKWSSPCLSCQAGAVGTSPRALCTNTIMHGPMLSSDGVGINNDQYNMWVSFGAHAACIHTHTQTTMASSTCPCLSIKAVFTNNDQYNMWVSFGAHVACIHTRTNDHGIVYMSLSLHQSSIYHIAGDTYRMPPVVPPSHCSIYFHSKRNNMQGDGHRLR